jgi:plastocyanin
MQLPRPLPIIGCLLSLGLSAGTLVAGQIRIDVGKDGGMTFTPAVAHLNQGDHVIWIWNSGSHSVTQGTPCVVPPTPIFSIGGPSGISSARATWKSDRTGTITYFCQPHCTGGMTGSLEIAAGGAPVADFRITEVHRTNEHENDYIEIANLGQAAGDFGGFRITHTQGSSPIDLIDVPVPAGGRILIHAGLTGTSTPSDIYLPSLVLTALGSVAVYVPNTPAPNTSTPWQMVDYVQWGGTSAAGDQNLRDTALEAEIWFNGTPPPVIPAGSSLEFCGTSGQYGAEFWTVASPPNPGTAGNCSIPVKPTTWSGVKRGS